MAWTVSRIRTGLQRRWLQSANNRRIARLAAQIEQHAPPSDAERPVAFFNASSRLAWMSQNAAFMLLSSWGLRLAGVPVIHFVCRAGMTRCQLGTNKNRPEEGPPCDVCVAQSRNLFRGGQIYWFDYLPSTDLEAALRDLGLPDLMSFTWQGLPLGGLVLPSLRWSLRRHHLNEDEGTRLLLREYIKSAWRVAIAFQQFLDTVNPRGLVVFNGISFPEAVARRLAQDRGLWVVTHEVGLQPYSGFFTRGQATAYPIHIPADYRLSVSQQERLNAYLENRLQGNFSMAGIKFWPEMRGLDQPFLEKLASFKQLVPVFTNVIFDTSQAHANVIFEQMFSWLDAVLEIIRAHSDTLFVIRAHPDEDRPGKQAEESVAGWARSNRLEELPNVIFVAPSTYISSYELIQRAKFVMIYNSTIGLEAAIMGAAVLCAGKARFTQLPTVFLPPSSEAYRQQAERFLNAERIDVPPEFQENARTFLYYQLYRTSLPFDRYLEPDLTPGFVRLRNDLSWKDFLPENSPAMKAVVDGILGQGDFLLPDDVDGPAGATG